MNKDTEDMDDLKEDEIYPEHSNIARITFIPYDLTKVKQNAGNLSICRFGYGTTFKSMDDTNYFILMGGGSHSEKIDSIAPTDIVWQCRFLNYWNKPKESIPDNLEHYKLDNYEWHPTNFYLPKQLRNFGVIELNLEKEEWRYLILFGGESWHARYEKVTRLDSVSCLRFYKPYEQISTPEAEKDDKSKHENKKEQSGVAKFMGKFAGGTPVIKGFIQKEQRQKALSDWTLHGKWMEISCFIMARICS